MCKSSQTEFHDYLHFQKLQSLLQIFISGNSTRTNHHLTLTFPKSGFALRYFPNWTISDILCATILCKAIVRRDTNTQRRAMSLNVRKRAEVLSQYTNRHAYESKKRWREISKGSKRRRSRKSGRRWYLSNVCINYAGEICQLCPHDPDSWPLTRCNP